MYDSKGQFVQSHELIEDGANVSVNNENKGQFIELYVEFILRKSV